MSDLGEKIKDLAVKYLLAETRNYNGITDNEEQAKELLHILSAKHIAEIFSLDRGEGKYNFSRAEYKNALEKIISNRNERELELANNGKQEILRKVVQEVIERMSEEAKAQGSANDSWKLKKQMADLKAELEFGKPLDAVTFWDRLNSRVNLPYLVILCLAVVMIGGLVFIGLTATMTVNVEFNIGEIIGSLLVGTGVAAAGVSYATRNKDENQSDKG